MKASVTRFSPHYSSMCVTSRILRHSLQLKGGCDGPTDSF